MSQNIEPVEAINLRNGIAFARHDAAVESIEKWAEENFWPQKRHQIICEGGSQDNGAESEVHGMRDEIKLFVSSDLQKVLHFLQIIFLG